MPELRRLGSLLPAYSMHSPYLLRSTMALAALLLGATLDTRPARAAMALRMPDGRLLEATPDGSFRPAPGDASGATRFSLVRISEDRLAMKTQDNRFLADTGKTLRVEAFPAMADRRSTFVLIEHADGPTHLRAIGYPRPASFDLPVGNKPSPQVVELVRITPVSSTLRAAASMILQGVVATELQDEQYDKVKSRQRVRYITLPTPRLRELRRTKKVEILSMQEETRVTARLDGPVELHISSLDWITPYRRNNQALLSFAVEGEFPVTGRVRYRLSDILSASCGYHTRAHVHAVGRIPAIKRENDRLELKTPRVGRCDVELRQLVLSNDILDTVRRPIQNAINRELDDNRGKIHQQANLAIAKSLKDQKLESPLLRFLDLP